MYIYIYFREISLSRQSLHSIELQRCTVRIIALESNKHMQYKQKKKKIKMLQKAYFNQIGLLAKEILKSCPSKGENNNDMRRKK